MNVFERAIDRAAYRLGWIRRSRFKRAYSAALANRLVSGWVTSPLSADADLRTSLRTMRARSRELEQNNDYARKFIRMVERNVVGPHGIRLQNKAANTDGSPDALANDKIEAAWRRFNRRGIITADGQLSGIDAQRLFIGSVARDGEILVRLLTGFDNEFRFALQFLEPDHLDEDFNHEFGDGSSIRMGVEFDRWRRPVAYHLLTQHPGDYTYTHQGHRYDRIPANEIIHGFLITRAGQSRGVPWMHSAMTRLNQLGGYEEAELVAARIGACKMGAIITGDGSYTGDAEQNDGSMLEDAEPGVFRILPKDSKLETFEPEHPTTAFPFFMKIMLRGISSGLDVAYNSLASDLEGVNYSSIRSGVLEERDAWRILQTWMAESFLQRVYDAWLPMAMLTQEVTLPNSKIEKFSKPEWQPRGWDWVDPSRDQDANVAAIAAGLKTRSQILAEHGRDVEEVFRGLAEEEKLAASLGLKLSSIVTGNPEKPAKKKETDSDEDD